MRQKYKYRAFLFFIASLIIIYVFNVVEIKKELELFCPKIKGFKEPVCVNEEILDYLYIHSGYTSAARRGRVIEKYKTDFGSPKKLHFVTYMHFRGLHDGKMIYQQFKEAPRIMLVIGGGVAPCTFYLLKKWSSIENKMKIVMAERVSVFIGGKSYNHERMVRKFFSMNGIDTSNILFINGEDQVERNKLPKLGPFDLVVSLRSLGFHYPLSIYLDNISKSMKSNSLFIFDEFTVPGKIQNFEIDEISLREVFEEGELIFKSRVKRRRVWVKK